MAKAVTRKNYLKGAKTLTFAAGGTDNIVLSGMFNQVNFSLRGTLATGAGGALVGKGILAAINRMQVVSTKHGTIVDFDGSDLYHISRAFFGSAAQTAATTGATTANCGFEAALPLSCDADESLTIYVTWTSAVTNIVSDATGYPGVLRVNAEVLPTNPETKWAWRKQIMGANGVIGAAGTFSQPSIPQVGQGFHLACAVMQVATTASPIAYADGLDSITLQQGVGNYILDDNAALLKHTFNILVPVANITGVYPLKWYPFQHTAETQLNITNGAAATVAGSQIVYGYCMKLAAVQEYAENPSLQPREPPTAPAIVQAPIEAPAPASAPFGGLLGGFNVPARPQRVKR